MAEQVLIEKYKGWDISFDIDNETFIVYSSFYDEEQQEKKSYPACKKYIDDFIKNNETFKPFKIVRPNSQWDSESVITLTGIRKDMRFTYEDAKGKRQFSEYDEKGYYLYEKWMDDVFKSAKIMEAEVEALRIKIKDYMKENFYSKATNLKTYKKEQFS